MKDFEGRDGCFAAFMARQYVERSEKFEGYADKTEDNRLSHCDQDKPCLSVLDESSPKQHQMKILFGLGIYFGFRGMTEHVNMLVSDITIVYFEEKHDYRGKQYVTVKFMVDKKQKITVHNPYKRKTEDLTRLPILTSDPTSNDFASSLVRYIGKMKEEANPSSL